MTLARLNQECRIVLNQPALNQPALNQPAAGLP